jgi:hypothetical protein
LCQVCIDKLEFAFKFAENIRKLQTEFFGPALGQNSMVSEAVKLQPIAGLVSNEAPKILKRKNQENAEQLAKKVRFIFEARSPGGVEAIHAETALNTKEDDVKIEKEGNSVAGSSKMEVQVKSEIDDDVQEVPIRDEVIAVDDLLEIKSDISTSARPIRSTRFHFFPNDQVQEKIAGETPTTSKRIKQELLENIGQSRFVCEFEGCGKVFERKSWLEQHKASHSGEFLVASILLIFI